MTWQSGSDYEEEANNARNEGELCKAAQLYTQATFEYLGQDGLEPKPNAAKAMMNLSLAATCYRVRGRDSQAKHRCYQGISLAEELSETALAGPIPTYEYDAAERGVWAEFIGDLRVVGELTSPEEAYREAIDVYENAGDPPIGLAEQIPMANIEYFHRVVVAADDGIEEFDKNSRDLTFCEWVDYKIDRLPNLLNTLANSGTFRTKTQDLNG